MIEFETYNFLVCVHCYTYNHAPYIVGAMNGFTMQKTDFPFICKIVDDASTDGEQGDIRQYLQEHFNIEDQEENENYELVLAQHKENRNCYFAVYFLKFNHYQKKKKKLPYMIKGMDKVKYIAMCEGDDYWINPQKLQMQVTFLEEHKEYIMSHTSIRYYYEYENKFYASKDKIVNSKIIEDGLTPEKILSGYRIQLCSVLIDHEAYKRAINLDPFLFSGHFRMGDTQLWYQLSKLGKIHFYPEVTCVYRKNEGSATKSGNIKGMLGFSLSSAELRLYLADKDKLNLAFRDKAKEKYIRAAIRYLCFDSSYQPLLSLKTSKCQRFFPLYKNLLLKPTLLFVYYNRTWLGYLRRLNKKEL